MATTTASWNEVKKKEARGINGYDLGEVQDTGTYYVHTQRGIESKTQYYIPKKMFKSYDGKTVHFEVDEANAKEFIGRGYPTDAEYRAKYEPPVREKPAMAAATMAPRMAQASTSGDILERIPLMTERLDVSKHVHQDEVTVTKVPYMETQTRDVPVMHEELRIEEAKPSGNTAVPAMKNDLNREEIRIPVSHEDVDVKKTPEVREELVIHKTPVTETRHISEEVRSEKFETSGNLKGSALEDEKKKRPVA
jgi:uncharacterized protein (TIGR02271 family)